MSVRNYPGNPVNGVSVVGAALSGAAVATVLTYTCPAGRQARVTFASVANFTLGPTVAIRVTIGGVTAQLDAAAALADLQCTAYLNAGDTADLRVTAAIGASSFDGCISVEEFAAT